MSKQLITFSRQASFKSCRRAHQFAYEFKLRKQVDAKALRMGSAHHDAIEQLGLGKGIEEACSAIRRRYENRPEMIDELDWAYEEETLLRIAAAYQWRWQSDQLTYVATEHQFTIPLLNPKTGRPTPHFSLSGKIDAIVQLSDGRLAVKESKLFGDNIESDSSLWRRMRLDQQVSLYVYAARQLGYEVDCVLYDVCRKNTIKPTQVPLLDDDGLKVVVDANGERVYNKSAAGKEPKPRQTGDSELGYTVLSRPMTILEWGDKLTEDIGNRPDFYFNRVEVARLDKDISDFMEEVWEIQQAIRGCQKSGSWWRTVNKNTCDYCSYFSQCESNWTPDNPVPDGFVILEHAHPELVPLEVL
jgi:hypothetical protein